MTHLDPKCANIDPTGSNMRLSELNMDLLISILPIKTSSRLFT